MAVTHKKILSLLILPAMVISMSGCSFISKGLKAIDDKYAERIEKILNEKADEYGISAEGVEVLQGGQSFKVPVGAPNTLDKIKDLVITHRRWQRFTYCECKNMQFSVSFYDKDHPEIWYGGFSDQDQGFDAELYFDDYTIFDNYTSRLHLYTSPSYKKAKWTPEQFEEMTGISTELAEEYRNWFRETFPSSGKDIKPDKSSHDITFIPGDTIMHREKFVIGDEKCPIPAGTYTVDLPNKRGIIHVTDSEGTIKYRIDARYRSGHTDVLYEYSPIPTQMTLNEGDIIYMTNCTSTFDKVSE
ncbi:MAG: hypothetical protein J5777_08780 [Clostridiales bacterium]|nr:hypothetical protein [Clostridiales bacterium]